MARSGFGSRLRYVLWLYHLVMGETLGFAELGEMVGTAARLDEPIRGQTVSGWVRREEAPNVYLNNKGLALALGVDEAWLIEGRGDPPRPDLWKVWIAARGRQVRQFNADALVSPGAVAAQRGAK